MIRVAALSDKIAIENAKPVSERWTARTIYEQLTETAAAFPDRPALTFQLQSGPSDPSVTLDWKRLREDVTRAANLFRSLGVGPEDVVAYILPNGVEAPLAFLGGATAGIVNPVNPLLAPEHIAGILRETRAKVVVTLAPFPKTDLAQNVSQAVALAPDVRTVLEVDLAKYVTGPMNWIVRAIRPRFRRGHNAEVVDFHTALERQNGDALDFEERTDDSVCAYFHTGGTTGLPKIAQHHPSGILYNGWIGKCYMFNEQDTLLCPLPMFHCFAAYPVLMSCVVSGAQIVFPTPQGYRGAGVMDNFWQLIERYGASFMITVPTAVSALMQRPVNADVSSLRLAISGSAAMPQELFRRFEEATGVTILEGYGMTETTCLISINPPFGERRIGSVGHPFPYTDVRILHCDAKGGITKECDTDEVGEICVRSPGVSDAVYTEAEKNRGLMTPDGYLRTGDLGRIDTDGYIWITGRAKDLIIRGGHNIDPAMIEQAFMHHPDVAFAGAIGQPDPVSGEVPAIYLELVEGSTADAGEIAEQSKDRIYERAAVPKHVEVLPELPKTAVGKVFKPELRKLAIQRVLDLELEKAGSEARVATIRDDKRLGLVAAIRHGRGKDDDDKAGHVLDRFVIPWEWSEGADPSRN